MVSREGLAGGGRQISVEGPGLEAAWRGGPERVQRCSGPRPACRPFRGKDFDVIPGDAV